MRIAFYTPWVPLSHPTTSGDVVIARNLVEALERQGHTVGVLPDYSTPEALRSWRGRLGIPAALRCLDVAAREFRPDVWLTCYSDRVAPDIPGLALAHRLGARYIVYGAVHRSSGGTWAGQLLNLLALRAADRVVVNKTRDLSGYQRYSWLRPKLSLLTPAVATDEFKPDPQLRARTRERLRLEDGTVVLLAASRLTYRGRGRKFDSLQFLIDRVRELVEAGRPVLLLVVGDGKARAELERHAAPLGDRVRFLGAVPHGEMSALYNASDIFAFPGLREPIGMVYLEAQAAGLPVVAFRNGGIPDVVRDGETGFLTPRLDAQRFAARLEQLVANSGLRSQLGEAGVDHVRQHHDLASWGATLTDLLSA
jgi:glycosyltransferase involved in cell wall biosynthesis